jgi:hypothetical protein
MKLENINILLTDKNVILVPEISEGLCNNCYFVSEKEAENNNIEFKCLKEENIFPCCGWTIGGEPASVIFKEKKNGIGRNLKDFLEEKN